jgi:hypothetical protein
MLKVALSPTGRKTIRHGVRMARSEEGRKLIAQARKIATGPEGRKLIAQARVAAKAAAQEAKVSERQAPLDTLRERLRKL